MKTVNVITIHFGENHGSALQAYALSKYISSQNCLCKVIDYIPPRYNMWGRYYKSYIKHHKLLLVIAYYPIYVAKAFPVRKIFRKFLQDYVPLTDKYVSNKELFSNPPAADIYIAGSDQIWNTDYNGLEEMAYFLEYVDKDKRKASYAASFGKDYPLSEEEIRFFSGHLVGFDCLSVREEAGLKILEDCGLSGKLVCDPTLLLSARDWEEIAKPINFTEKYVLVYVMDAIYDIIVENAYRIAKQIDAKVYVIDFNPINDERIDKCFYKCSPNMFISLMKGASFVVTNSFHGSVFATIFGKPLAVNKKNKYNSRIETLLTKSNQSKRIFEEKHIVSEEEIEWLVDNSNCGDSTVAMKDWIENSKIYLNELIK